jgi:hypothetical protein
VKRTLQTIITSLALVLGVGTMAAPAASAINVFEGCDGNARTEVCKAKDEDNTNTLVQDIINLLLFTIGIISVIMIIVGGIRYALSNGDASNIKTAKDTILYAIIGLVVALLAFAIVNFVVARF